MQWPNISMCMCISAICYCIHKSVYTQVVISCLNGVFAVFFCNRADFAVMLLLL